MEFNPNNPIIKLCIEGMDKESSGKQEEAAAIFSEAWEQASNDLEKYLAAYYLARQQTSLSERLNWLEKSLEHALGIDDAGVKGAYPSLYKNIAQCYEELADADNARKYRELSESSQQNPEDMGPFYHGTRADLKSGDFLTPGNRSNYQEELVMNHIYFTALPNGAGLAAALANGEGRERVYIVEPTGSFENDPNVTDKKFPGNPTRSYRTAAPLKIVGELEEWNKVPAEEIKKWRERLSANKGEIIN